MVGNRYANFWINQFQGSHSLSLTRQSFKERYEEQCLNRNIRDDYIHALYSDLRTLSYPYFQASYSQSLKILLALRYWWRRFRINMAEPSVYGWRRKNTPTKYSKSQIYYHFCISHFIADTHIVKKNKWKNNTVMHKPRDENTRVFVFVRVRSVQ